MTARIAKLDVRTLSDQQRELYDAITGGPRAAGPQLFRLTDEDGRLEGPFNAMLLSPVLGGALQSLGSAVRYRSGFSDRCREIAILVVGHTWNSEFEIYAHQRVARAAGLTQEDLAALAGDRPDLLPDDLERLVATTTSALAGPADLTDEQYELAVAGLGEALLFELTTLVGYYSLLALQLRIFRVGVPR